VQEQAVLSIQNLGRQVSGRWLWRGVSFDLKPGDRLGLVAPSGAGKTLLLRSIVLLDPVQEGQISFQGKDLKAWDLPSLRRQMVYLPQRATAFPGTVWDNLQRALTLKVNQGKTPHADGRARGEGEAKFPADHRILSWLQQLGRSEDFLTLQAQQLSGGETQILALLRSLQLDPQVLLLDEPTASLDADTTDQVEALLQTWLQDGNRACLITSHDRHQIERFTTRQLDLREFR
jgi:putative ABC transport system ATP-binding protein